MELEQLFTSANRNFILATQNIDGFHSLVGSKNVIELHGNLFKVRCTKCGKVTTNHVNPICPALAGRGAPEASASNAPRIATKDLPHCIDCGGLLRPHVVWFGENLDPVVLENAEQAAISADVCLVVGTSAVVYPAAGLALKAAKRGIPVAEINLEPTPATSAVTFYFEGQACVILPQLVKDLTLK
nr:NAD dependent deacetylase sirtuin 5 [Hymenolepis microstoma]